MSRNLAPRPPGCILRTTPLKGKPFSPLYHRLVADRAVVEVVARDERVHAGLVAVWGRDAVLGIPATQVLPAAGVAGVQVYLGSDLVGGTPGGEAQVPLPDDIVNQTAGDVVCQQANPYLITR